MSFDVRNKIIITIIFGIVGLTSFLLIICFVCWFIIRYYRLKRERIDLKDDNDSPVISSYRRHQQYLRPPHVPSVKISSNINNNFSKSINKKRKKTRFNTNDSALTFTFDAPHLINQNVKNLDKLLSNDSTLTANSWQYEETLPERHWYS